MNITADIDTDEVLQLLTERIAKGEAQLLGLGELRRAFREGHITAKDWSASDFPVFCRELDALSDEVGKLSNASLVGGFGRYLRALQRGSELAEAARKALMAWLYAPGRESVRARLGGYDL